MLPEVNEMAELLAGEEEIETEPSLTYKLHMEGKRILGMADELDAMKQAVYKILNTERYQYLMYSWDYGIELQDLYGEPMPYVIPELERRVKEALLQDERILEVSDFSFEVLGNELCVEFVVKTIYGEFEEGVEVEV